MPFSFLFLVYFPFPFSLCCACVYCSLHRRSAPSATPPRLLLHHPGTVAASLVSISNALPLNLLCLPHFYSSQQRCVATPPTSSDHQRFNQLPVGHQPYAPHPSTIRQPFPTPNQPPKLLYKHEREVKTLT